MRAFLIKCFVFLFLLLGSILTIFLIEGGYSDPFYLKFTTPKQGSLILGTSRAAQGVIPAILNKELAKLTKHPFYNYAFTLANSPYGDVYLSSIQHKVADSNDGIFILAVDPWSIATGDSSQADVDLPERRNFLANVRHVSINPNLEYMLKFYPDFYVNIVGSRLRPSHRVLHDDGWLEINLAMDSTAQAYRMHKMINMHKKKGSIFHISSVRLDYLCRTIAFLKRHGRVFLIRIPIGKEMRTLEETAMPAFVHKMDSIALTYGVPFLDMSTETEGLRFTDGHHLHKTSSARYSRDLADTLKTYLSRRR